MKNIKKFMMKISVMALACVAILGGVGCSPTSSDNSQSSSVGGQPIVTEEGLYAISSFETYEQIQGLTWSRHFGRAELNKDKSFIVDGEASVKLQPYGDPETKVAPQITVGLQKSVYGYTDFTQVKYVSLDFYNTSDDVTVEYWLTTENVEGVTETLPVKSTTLKKDSWTRISYDFSSGVFGLLYDMSYVKTFCVKFTDYRKTTDPYTPRTLYMDGLKVYQMLEPIEYSRTTAKDVIMNFESLQDLYLLQTSALDNATADSYSISYDARPGAVAEGKQSLFVKGNCSIKVDSRLLSSADIQTAEKISFKIKTLGQAASQIVFKVACKYDRIFEFDKIVTCTEDEWTVVTMEKSELENFTFADMQYFTIEVRSGYSWIDDIKFN